MLDSHRTDLMYARRQLALAQRYAAGGRLSATADCIGRAMDALERIEPCTNRADGIECDCPICEEAERNNSEDRATRESR